MSREELKQWIAANNHNAFTFGRLLRVTERTVYRWLAGTTPVPKWMDRFIQGLDR